MILQAHAGAIPLKGESIQACVTSPPFWRARLRNRAAAVVRRLDRRARPRANSRAVCRAPGRSVQRGAPSVATGRHCLGAMEDGYAGGGIAHRDPGRWPKAGNVQYPRGKKWDRSLKSKDLTDTAWRLALALQKDGWYLRDDIVVAEGNPFPEAAKRDRPYRSHGYLFG